MENQYNKWKEIVVRGISPNLHAAFRSRCCRENVASRSVVLAIMERYVLWGIQELMPMQTHRKHLKYKELPCKFVSPYLHAAFKMRCEEEKEQVYSMKSVIIAGIERYVKFGAEGMRIPADARTLNNGKKKTTTQEVYNKAKDPFAYLGYELQRNTR